MRIWIWLLATVALILVLSFPLGVPGGIVAFELADTPEEARAIIRDWRDHGATTRAYWNLWVDFAFIVAYVTFTGMMAARVRGGVVGVAAALGAGVLDVVENVTLLGFHVRPVEVRPHQLRRRGRPVWTAVQGCAETGTCSSWKRRACGIIRLL